MGAVVGERFVLGVEQSIKNHCPFICFATSGGARMQESILSLMQMAKTCALLAKYDEVRAPFISILTNPTTAGVMASYASLGDVIIAEPKALLGFAGRRVIQQTIGAELPPGFQSSEFVMEHGFLDKIVHRKDLKTVVSSLIDFLG